MDKNPDQVDLLKQAVEAKKEKQDLNSLSEERAKKFEQNRDKYRSEGNNPSLLEKLLHKSDKGGKGR